MIPFSHKKRSVLFLYLVINIGVRHKKHNDFLNTTYCRHTMDRPVYTLALGISDVRHYLKRKKQKKKKAKKKQNDKHPFEQALNKT